VNSKESFPLKVRIKHILERTDYRSDSKSTSWIEHYKTFDAIFDVPVKGPSKIIDFYCPACQRDITIVAQSSAKLGRMHKVGLLTGLSIFGGSIWLTIAEHSLYFILGGILLGLVVYLNVGGEMFSIEGDHEIEVRWQDM
jgi:hypothetical protein